MTRTRFRLATVERYAEGAERELAWLAELELTETEPETRLSVAQTTAEVKARLAGVAAALRQAAAANRQAKLQENHVAVTVRLAEAQETHNMLLAQLGELLSLHPVLNHVAASRGMIAEQNELLTEKDKRILELELEIVEAKKKKEASRARRTN